MTTQRQTGRPHRLSVVIPATDIPAFEDTLVSVLENRPHGCEVIAALGTSYDDPWNIREEVTFVEARGPGLLGCVNAGIAAATGDVVHVLAAGWKATDGWTDRALEHFSRDDVGAVVPVAVADADRDQPVSVGVRRTPGGRVMPVVPRRHARGGMALTVRPSAPALEAGFWRADVLADGGFTTACGEANAAADMSAALKAAGLDVVVEPDARVVRGPVPRRSGAFLAGLHAERLFWRSLPCERVLPALVAHVGEVMRHAAARAPLGTLAMLAGRLTALVQFGSCVPRGRQLAALMQQAGARRAAEPGDSRAYRIDTPHDAIPAPHAPPARRLKRSA